MLQIATFSPHHPLAEAANALLDGLEPVDGLHALIVGADGPETMCELIRRGCAAAAETAFDDPLWPQSDSAELVVVPHVASRAQARQAVTRGQRALIMGGRIAQCDVTSELRPVLVALLRTHGFCAICTRLSLGVSFITAERPMFGPPVLP